MPFSWKGFGAVSDGTSNTIAASEAGALADRNNGREINGAIAKDKSRVSECAASKAGKMINTTGTLSAFRARRFLFGSADNRFNTVLPPNSPSCAFAQTMDDYPSAAIAGGEFMRVPGVFSASSNHTGGVNAGLMDGSVQFVSDTVDSLSSGRTLADADVNKAPSGASMYGVWGAMGTPSGGESKAL